MKTALFFDVDNTIYCHKTKKVPDQTYKLIKKLSEKENIVLGLATGRGLKSLKIVESVLPFFTYKVLYNGAFVMKEDKVLYAKAVQNEDLEQAKLVAFNHDLVLGMVGLDDYRVFHLNEKQRLDLNLVRHLDAKVEPDYYLKEKVYQLWMFSKSDQDIKITAGLLPKFRVLPWHQGGADIVYQDIDKASGIKQVLDHESINRLICVGDGANDIEMIELADIGIVMNNTRFIDLKEKADHIAPHILEDQLYDFFHKLNLV